MNQLRMCHVSFKMAFSLLDDFYECSLCLNDMTDGNPRVLACYHSFCERCLVKVVKRGSIECPVCHHVTSVTDSDVTLLSKDFMFLRIKERERNFLPTVKYVTYCQICDVEVAEHKCLDCNELMCQKCTHKHSTSQRYKNHKVVVKCASHNEGITHICVKCIEGVCGKCMILYHSDHDDFVYEYKHGMDLLHTNIKKLSSVFKKEVISVELIVEEEKRKIKKDNESKKLLKEKREKLLAEAEKIKGILDQMDRGLEKQEIIKKECEEALKTGHNVLQICERLNQKEGDEFLSIYHGIKQNLAIGLNKTNDVRQQYDSSFIPVELPVSDYKPLVRWEKKPVLIATYTKGKPFTLNCPWQVACLDNNLLAIADLKEGHVLIVNYEGKVMMSYKVKRDDGDVTSVYSNDGKRLYIVQRKCITTACYPSANTKTYHPDLPDMRGMYAQAHTKYIIYNNTTVCEYEPTTNKVKQVVRGLNNCYMCLPYKDSDTNSQMKYVVVDDNDTEDNIKIYNDRWILTHSFGPHGSQNGMLDGPRRAVIVDNKLLVCDKNNDRVSCFTLEGEFMLHILTNKKGVECPFGIGFRFPFLWITGLQFQHVATLKGFKYAE